jgi:hypothetical protein
VKGPEGERSSSHQTLRSISSDTSPAQKLGSSLPAIPIRFGRPTWRSFAAAVSAGPCQRVTFSPSDRVGEIEEKVQERLLAGCREVWVVSPRLKAVTIHRSPTDIRVLTSQDTLDSPELLPGFACPVSDLFEDLPASAAK